MFELLYFNQFSSFIVQLGSVNCFLQNEWMNEWMSWYPIWQRGSRTWRPNSNTSSAKIPQELRNKLASCCAPLSRHRRKYTIRLPRLGRHKGRLNRPLAVRFVLSRFCLRFVLRFFRTDHCDFFPVILWLCLCSLSRTLGCFWKYSFIHSFICSESQVQIRQCVTQCEPDSKAQKRTLTAAL